MGYDDLSDEMGTQFILPYVRFGGPDVLWGDSDYSARKPLQRVAVWVVCAETFDWSGCHTQ